MTDAVAETEECIECGAEVRAEAQFCFNCGFSIEPDAATEQGDEEVSNAWLRDDLGKNEDSGVDREELVEESSQPERDSEMSTPEKNQLEPEEVDDKDDPDAGKSTLKTEGKSRVRRKSEMKSAASLRKKPKSLQNRKVEVVWEEKNDSPNIRFIILSVGLVLLASGLFYLAITLK